MIPTAKERHEWTMARLAESNEQMRQAKENAKCVDDAIKRFGESATEVLDDLLVTIENTLGS